MPSVPKPSYQSRWERLDMGYGPAFGQFREFRLGDTLASSNPSLSENLDRRRRRSKSWRSLGEVILQFCTT